MRAKQDIPQAHKIALCDIPEGGKIIRYGVVLGYAINPIGKGQWITPAHKSKTVFLPFQMPLPYPAAMAFETATQTVRITHYTLHAKSCAKRGVAPFGYPHNKTALCPMTGA